MTVYNVLKDLKDPALTFTAVAKRHSLSASSVALIFDRAVIVSRRPLPVCLSLDEVAAFKTPQSNYVCILVDYIDKKVVDLLPSRKKADLIDYFYTIPLKERKKVKYVSFDMWFLCEDLHNGKHIRQFAISCFLMSFNLSITSM